MTKEKTKLERLQELQRQMDDTEEKLQGFVADFLESEPVDADLMSEHLKVLEEEAVLWGKCLVELSSDSSSCN